MNGGVLQGTRAIPHTEMNRIQTEMGGKGFGAKNLAVLCVLGGFLGVRISQCRTEQLPK